jgi:ribosomal protein L40E
MLSTTQAGKVCRKCNACLPLDRFARVSEKYSHLKRSWCIDCSRAARKEWYQKNRDYAVNRERERRSTEKFRTQRRQKNRWALENDLKYRSKRAVANTRAQAKRNNSIPCITSIEEITAAYTGNCSICGKPEARDGHLLRLDHCHTTGEFRGWLCFHCNTMLGMAFDSDTVLMAAVNYLRSHNKSAV